MKLRFDPDLNCPKCNYRIPIQDDFMIEQDEYESASSDERIRCLNCGCEFYFVLEFKRSVVDY